MIKGLERTEAEHHDLIQRMAVSLKRVPDRLLDSGTERRGAYARAQLLNFGVKHNVKMMNLHEGEDVHGWLDREAYTLERDRRRHAQSENEI
jgi:hypothetical protein